MLLLFVTFLVLLSCIVVVRLLPSLILSAAVAAILALSLTPMLILMTI